MAVMGYCKWQMLCQDSYNCFDSFEKLPSSSEEEKNSAYEFLENVINELEKAGVVSDVDYTSLDRLVYGEDY